jgi:hypothetical protein
MSRGRFVFSALICGKHRYPTRSILQISRDRPRPVCGARLVQFLQANWFKLLLLVAIGVAVFWAALPHGKRSKETRTAKPDRGEAHVAPWSGPETNNLSRGWGYFANLRRLDRTVFRYRLMAECSEPPLAAPIPV